MQAYIHVSLIHGLDAIHYPKMQRVMDENMPKTSKCVPGKPILELLGVRRLLAQELVSYL